MSLPESDGVNGFVITRDFTDQAPSSRPLGPRNYVPTSQEMIAEYDAYAENIPPGMPPLGHDFVRNALELGFDINDLPAFMRIFDPGLFDLDMFVDGVSRRSMLYGNPFPMSKEGYIDENYPSSLLLEQMYNELNRRATGM